VQDFAIRFATPGDAETIARHRAQMFREMGDLADADYESLVSETAAFLRGALASGEYIGWLATPASNPAIVAAGAGLQIRPLLPHPQPGKRGLIAGRQGLILNVFVERPYRRHGLARSLVREVLAWAASHNIGSIVLHASRQGRPLYEQLGFVPTNEMRYAGQRPLGVFGASRG
jgi:GNAT superfamily N-acetyltransferase